MLYVQRHSRSRKSLFLSGLHDKASISWRTMFYYCCMFSKNGLLFHAFKPFASFCFTQNLCSLFRLYFELYSTQNPSAVLANHPSAVLANHCFYPVYTIRLRYLGGRCFIIVEGSAAGPPLVCRNRCTTKLAVPVHYAGQPKNSSTDSAFTSPVNPESSQQKAYTALSAANNSCCVYTRGRSLNKPSCYACTVSYGKQIFHLFGFKLFCQFYSA